jgi:predicted Ser/Thr protein kinase
MVGQTIGKYRVVSRLGRGGMGTVYKAVDETLEREVAIKCLNPDLADADVLRRFRAEAIMLARLNHPNIATLFELTEHGGDLLMVMEFVRGETFDHVSASGGPMSFDRAARLCRQVLDALAYAHRAGVVHRDLKPANLMLTESGQTKVMDFGIARMAGTEHLTLDGFMMGTPAYMAPEQVLGGEIDGRTDLYAMGVVFYRLLTAHLPFKADSGIAMVQKQISDPPTPVRQFRADLPPMCQEILTRAMAKAPADRYQTAEEFRDALAGLDGVSPADFTSTRAMPPPIAASPDLEPTLPPMLTPVLMEKPMTQVGGQPVVVGPPPPTAPPARARSAAAVVVGLVLLAAAVTGIVLFRRTAGAKPASEAGTPTASVAAPAAAPNVEPSASAAVPAAAPTLAPPVVPPSTPIARDGGARSTGSERGNPAPDASGSSPLVTFEKVRLLVSDDGRAGGDRDASLRLEPDRLQVVDGSRTLNSTAYRDIIGLFHSHSREPKWATPAGTTVLVAKAGGKFSFLKGTPDWITVRTKSAFIPLRVQGGDLDRLIAALEARTGTKIVRAR